MGTFHYYCEYGNLESMLIGLNSSIRELNSYLSTKVEKINPDNKVSALTKLLGILDNTEQLTLSQSKTICCKTINNIKDARDNSDKSPECKHIEMVWRECRDRCGDVKSAIEEMKIAINDLKDNIVNNETTIDKLIRICGSKKSSLEPMINPDIVKEIYDKTIKKQYQLTSECKLICKCMVCVLSIVIIGVFICGFFCSCSNNKNEKNISVIIAERNIADTICTCPGEIIDKKIIGLDSLLIATNKKGIDIQFLLFKDSVLVLDSTFILKSDYKYNKSDFLINRIIIIPSAKCKVYNTCIKVNHHILAFIFRIIIIIVLAGALILLLLILRRQWEKENEIEQKILNERLKVQNEWQELLQSRYRLAIRRQEIEMSIDEKERKAAIDESIRHNENEMKIEMEYKKQNGDLMSKILDLKQATINKNNVSANELAELFAQIKKLTSKL